MEFCDQIVPAKVASSATLWGQRLWKVDLADRYTFGGTDCLHWRLFGVSVCGKWTLPTGTHLEAQTALGRSSFRDDFFEPPKPKRNSVKMCRILNMRERIKKNTHARTHKLKKKKKKHAYAPPPPTHTHTRHARACVFFFFFFLFTFLPDH